MSIIKKFIFTSCLIIIIAVIGFVYLVFHDGKSFISEKIISSNFVKQQIGQENESLFKLAPRLLGFTKPMTYLVLFENNTELRPSGGFIGSYAVVKMNKGQMEMVKVEGTEVLDKNTPKDWQPLPPQILQDHLKVDRWYFRDANWSPDFAESAKKALELYAGEGGVEANNIDAVVAITPTVLEELLKLTGPIEVQGIKFTADDVTEKLEYEVEYGYDEKGIHFLERKNIMEPLARAILAKLKSGVFFSWKEYLDLLSHLAQERQIMAYAKDGDLQKIIRGNEWSGELKNVEGDYLLWADANLASLKTDCVIERKLTYSLNYVEPEKESDFIAFANGFYEAEVKMIYKNTGKFDWRTTRYRTYARIFVPLGSQLVSVDGAMKWDRSNIPGIVDKGEELGKTWFGAFVAIEPGQTKTLTFKYFLPGNIAKQIIDGSYKLFVQKQLGTIANGLTLNLNFGTNTVSSTPEGIVKEGVYEYSGDLTVDRSFELNF